MKYGIQLYSVRDSMKVDFEGTIRKIAALGYESVEFAGFFGKTAEEVNRILGEAGLFVSSTHSDWKDLRDRFEETAAFHTAIGNKFYIIPGADLSTPENLDGFIKVINDVQPRLADRGITLGYHNHSREFENTPYGYRIHDVLAEKTELEFEIDTFWAYNAGENPMELMRRYKSREHMLHLKDGFIGGKGIPLGQGTAPLKEVVATAKELGLYCVVESETLNPDGMTEATVCADWLKVNG